MAYTYALGENDSFVADYFADGSLMSIYNIDFVAIKDLQGKDLYTGSRSHAEGTVRMAFPEGQ